MYLPRARYHLCTIFASKFNEGFSSRSVKTNNIKVFDFCPTREDPRRMGTKQHHQSTEANSTQSRSPGRLADFAGTRLSFSRRFRVFFLQCIWVRSYWGGNLQNHITLSRLVRTDSGRVASKVGSQKLWPMWALQSGGEHFEDCFSLNWNVFVGSPIPSW